MIPDTDRSWLELRDFLQAQLKPTDAILAPIEFLDEFPSQSYPYNVAGTVSLEKFEFVVFHKGMLADVNFEFTLQVFDRFQPVFANPVFVVYSANSIPNLPDPNSADLNPLLAQIKQTRLTSDVQPTQRCAIVVTTYNNSAALAKTLPAIAELGMPILLVDDGSTEPHARLNQQIVSGLDPAQVSLLNLPSHQQQPTALNAGLSYWLADRSIEWISCFADHVQVQPDLFQQLRLVQDRERYPLITGYDAPEHSGIEAVIGNQTVQLKTATSGQHLHAHRQYWQDVLPIPTLYAADQLRLGQGSDADWWITAWSPNSIVKRGGHVVCIPNLVASFDAAPKQLATALEPAVERILTDLSLHGVKVLVDGFNLQLTKGTGIKTYGLSLVEALQQMNAQVDVLLSRGGYKSNEILDEIFFFDNQTSQQDLLTVSKWILKSLSPLYRAKRRKSFAGLVVKRGQYSEDFMKYATSFSLPQCYDLANGLYNKLRWTTQVAIAEKVDIWHATYPLPMQVRGAKKITTVHDLIPFRLPYATLDDKKVFYFKVRDALKDSAVTITVSENSKQDLLTYYDADPDKIIVTYQPIALKPLDAGEAEIAFFLRRYGLKFQNYILFVGAIEPKKNVGRLIDAYASMDTDMPLVIVGKKGWLWEDELGKMNLIDSKQKTIKLLEYISVESLRYLYSGAYCLVFPSLYEGFGLPPLEAMSFGCPVITANVSCLPEICGDAALYVDPYSVQDIKAKLETLISDSQLRERLVRSGKVNAQAFSAANYQKRLHQAYRKALES
ncbi:MAG: glycosyltransferase [Pegethrix bostrychoides GSE-TBD4-15B]|jgi:glycosyltransferase involved in cell wall biosynthesis|uniref:Glycosyltransferase n=1 Tax=Pegethrix bostrychoides GSE-TBD4-15B TaxID=2839662 RepID=A0A951P7K4_9CYAN|nr:glycosyltransferase [Pegethrix bostrychoides GSE-TBD4-15B]